MDFSHVLEALENAHLFDLYRLQIGILSVLNNPRRIDEIKRHVQPGMHVSYFNSDLNSLVNVVVEEVRRTMVLVRHKEDGKQMLVRFFALNLTGINVDIDSKNHQRLDKNRVKVGDNVMFLDRQNREKFGVVTKLNPTTASIRLRDGSKWRVSYECVSLVTEAVVGSVEML